MALRRSPDVQPGAIEGLRDDLGLSRDELAQLLKVQVHVVESLERSDTYPVAPEVRALLEKLEAIRELALIVYTPEGAKQFIRVQIRYYDWQTPMDLLLSGRFDEVYGILAGEYEGQGF